MKDNLDQLFIPFSINGCEIKNRNVASTGQATVVVNNDDGFMPSYFWIADCN